MYRNKKEVDKHVENLLNKLSMKEFTNRAYSIARLYYEVGDYINCKKYVEQYLTQKDNNAAAHKLLGQALLKIGYKDKAFEQYKISFNIDATQITTILDICELLADEEIPIELGRAKYWCEKAEATFPSHPVTFRLRERLVTMSNPDPNALLNLLTAELATRPKDPLLHARLLKYYLQSNKLQEAFNHGYNVEFGGNTFSNNYAWYEILADLLKQNLNNNDWLYQLFLLTVKERLTQLSLTETPTGTSKSLFESNELLHSYDQSIEAVAKSGPPTGHSEFHAKLLLHHRGQFAFLSATFLLKKAKKDQLSWNDASKYAAPLMLMAWHTMPLDTKVNWLKNAPEKQLNAVKRWYAEGTYRCSQSGHYLLSNIQDQKSQYFLDQVSQCCSGTHWRDKLYEKIFPNRNHLNKIKTSHFVSTATNTPLLRLPRKNEVQAYDCDAQKEYGNSLHHFVWTLLNYKNFAQFKCTIFDMLTPTATSMGPESLNKMDIHAFLFCAALTAQQQKANEVSNMFTERPNVIPSNITDLLCPLSQMKWWDCAYKFSQNELGTELTDIRATLNRGIEVVRCIDNHGLDPELLCKLGYIFSEWAKNSTLVDEKTYLESRACLYYKSAIPLLDKLKRQTVVKVLDKRLFDYTHKQLTGNDLNLLLEESKLYVAVNHLNDCEYEKVIEVLNNVKSPQAYYHMAMAFNKIATDEKNVYKGTADSKLKQASLLAKAKNYAYKSLNRFRETDRNMNSSMFNEIQELIEKIETDINKIDPDISGTVNDVDGRYSSDENISSVSELISRRPNYRNLSSTPKTTNTLNQNTTNYRTAIDSQILDSTRVDQQYLERIEKEIKNLHKRDTTVNDFMEQTRNWFDENRVLGNKIMSNINSNFQHTTDQFKLLKISVDQLKEQIEECRIECKDVGELKKQLADLKKEINKMKKSSEQTIDENDLYNLEEDYRTNESNSAFAAQLPFNPAQVIPPFNQRLVPPFPVPHNPYQLYGHGLFNLYNQYSQLAQSTTVPGVPPLLNYPGVYPTPDQMYPDIAHLISNIPTANPVSVPPVAPVVNTLPNLTIPAVPISSTVTSTGTKFTGNNESKEKSQLLPGNVVITSSEPLPTNTTAPAPVLSVIIPSKHIKGTPHNYQIQMPSTNDAKFMAPPVFSFPLSETKTATTATWNQIFDSQYTSSPSLNLSKTEVADESKTVVDGVFNNSYLSTSHNKSRTISERSNTSVENYDPCPDFKPIVPLPAEVKVTTGEEDEKVIFTARAKLYRFVDKQWKERGLGVIKLLKHLSTNKVRVLMRREQIHKICANHIITPEMEIKPMKNETKAYFWVANDYADETLVLEKFCVRFKTADIAQEFYDTFEKARAEFKSDVVVSTAALPITTKHATATFSTGKTVVGGFTFNSTPAFKPTTETTVETKNTEANSNKSNVFTGITFKTNTNSSPFSNLFGITNSQPGNAKQDNQETPSKLNTSDTVDEFEPNVEFKPVVPLPALVEQKTGEENETSLFEHRAKLLRFDASTKEWKERGLGNIKLLVHKENTQKLRLLMRREQIMKVCCNHVVTKEMVFQKMPNMDKAVTWCAKDFSEGELVAETFCLRFKTVQLCDDFVSAVKTAQSKMKDDSKAAKEEQNAAKQNSQVGFGDKFKPKAGSWHCDSCYTNNLENFAKCACCEQPRPGNIISGDSKDASVKDIKEEMSANLPKFNFGIPGQVIKNDGGSTVKFSFTLPSKTEAPSTTAPPVSTAQVATGWGDQFKPKDGTWSCKQCYLRNEGNIDECVACNNPRDPNAVKKPSETPAMKFNFGIPQTTDATDINKKIVSSIFDGTGAHKFNFGIPSDTIIAPATTETPAVANIFGIHKEASTEGALNFALKKDDNVTSKPSLFTIPQTGTVTSTTGSFDYTFEPKTPPKSKSQDIFASPRSPDEDSNGEELENDDDSSHISFKPIIPLPDKVKVVTGEENETELYAHRAKLYRYSNGEWKECGIGIVKILKHKDTNKLRVLMRREQVHKICLNHVLTADVVYTPKDEKTWLFAANDFSDGAVKLQNFCIRFQSKEVAGDFKNAIDLAREGKADLKAEKSKPVSQTDNDDVVFVSEIQATTQEKQKAKELMLPENFFTYKNKDPCHGCRGCMDQDEEQQTIAVDQVLTRTSIFSSTGTATPVKTSTPTFQSPMNSVYGTPGNGNQDKTFDTSIFRTPLGAIGSNTTSFTQSSNSSDSTITDSMNKENSFLQPFNISSNFVGQKSIFGPSAPVNQTSTNSLLLTTPKLGMFNANTTAANTSVESTEPQTVFSTIQSKSVFGDNKSVFGESKSVFGESKPVFGESKPVFGESKPVFGETKSIFGETKSLFGDTKPVFGATKSIFGDAKPVFGTSNTGTSSNRSIFSFSENNRSNDQNKEVKSISEADHGKPTNLFGQGTLFGSSNTDKPSTSIFAAAAAKTFGSTSVEPTVFGNEKSLFSGNTYNQTPISKSSVESDQIKPEEKSSDIKDDKVDNEKEKKAIVLSTDKSLSFAALSSSAPGFGQKNVDFQWEGAGQQLFTAAQRAAHKIGDKSHNDSGVDDAEGAADEEYDPHYEPIVPLPDKIVVKTGEEDEEKLFGERCKLYRYDEKTREWKERGVGEMKLLYHPEKNSYRLLLRRELVHKAVLNMLLFMDLELLPMKNSDRAWTWVGRNFAETAAGEQETLAVRFKKNEQANAFRSKVDECVRKLQAAAAQAIREEKESDEKPVGGVAPLRLPKHLEVTARVPVVPDVAAPSAPHAPHGVHATSSTPPEVTEQPDGAAQILKQVHFLDTEAEEQEQEEEEEDYDQDYDAYYNEEEEEIATYFSCEAEAVIREGAALGTCPLADVLVAFDQEVYSPKIILSDHTTGEKLADMLIHTDTVFQCDGNSVTWSGVDYTRSDPVDKTITVNFFDNDTAVQFYDSCETSKAATYSSTDPES